MSTGLLSMGHSEWTDELSKGRVGPASSLAAKSLELGTGRGEAQAGSKVRRLPGVVDAIEALARQQGPAAKWALLDCVEQQAVEDPFHPDWPHW